MLHKSSIQVALKFSGEPAAVVQVPSVLASPAVTKTTCFTGKVGPKVKEITVTAMKSWFVDILCAFPQTSR